MEQDGGDAKKMAQKKKVKELKVLDSKVSQNLCKSIRANHSSKVLKTVRHFTCKSYWSSQCLLQQPFSWDLSAFLMRKSNRPYWKLMRRSSQSQWFRYWPRIHLTSWFMLLIFAIFDDIIHYFRVTVKFTITFFSYQKPINQKYLFVTLHICNKQILYVSKVLSLTDHRCSCDISCLKWFKQQVCPVLIPY